MSLNPLVSIVIPVFNRGNLIKETLSSIISQSYENWECIIVDDRSTDNTIKLLEEYIQKDARFKFFKRPKELLKGANTCRNYGFDKSKGDYINWFDSDDLMHVNCLEKKVKKIIEGKFDFVSCELSSFVENKNNNKVIKNNYEGNLLINYFCGDLAFYTPGPLWSKSFLLKNQLKYDNESKVLNDWIFNLRALFLTKNFFLIKEPLILYRYHPNSISGSLANGTYRIIMSEFETRKLMFEIFKKNGLINHKIVNFYLNRLIFLLRSLLVYKNKDTLLIYFFILKVRYKNKLFISKKINTTIGFLLYKFCNRGYKFLTPENK